MRNIFRKGLPAGLIVAGVAVALPSSVGAASVNRTFMLGPGQTKTFHLACVGGNAYGCTGAHSGKTIVEPPATGARGTKPNLSKVRILSQGVNSSYTVFSARVRNANDEGTAPVRIKLVAVLALSSS